MKFKIELDNKSKCTKEADSLLDAVNQVFWDLKLQNPLINSMDFFTVTDESNMIHLCHIGFFKKLGPRLFVTKRFHANEKGEIE